jgi:hypothetical protein
MKRRELTVCFVLLTMVFACLSSVTLYAGEHPWDADKGGDSGGFNGIPGGGDTLTLNPDTTAMLTTAVYQPQHPTLDIRSLILFKMSYYAAMLFERHTTSLKNVKGSVRRTVLAR